MEKFDIPGGGIVNLEEVPGFGGSPERAALAGRELMSIGGRLRAQSRTSSVAGARATRTWQGSASIAYANRNNGHVRSTASGSQAVDQAGRSAQDFGKRLHRIQQQGKRALRTRKQLSDELHRALRDRRHLAAGIGGELDGVGQEIADLRRQIRAQDKILLGLNQELVRLRRKFGDELLRDMPEGMRYWYQSAKDGQGSYKNIKTFLVVPGAVAALTKAAKTYRTAVNAGDSTKAAAAVKEFKEAQSKLLRIPGNPLGKVDRLDWASKTRAGERILHSPWGRRVDAAGKGARVVDHSAVKLLRRYAGPIGAVATVYDGTKDAATGGGKDGVQGTVTRVTGAGAVAGTALIVATGAGPVGIGAVAVWMVWKGGMALWDRSRGYRPRPQFQDDTRAKRMRRFTMENLAKVEPDPTNIKHRLYVEQGYGPMPTS